MPTEPKLPTVKERLEIVEALIRREERMLALADPLALHEEDPNAKLIQEGEENDLRQALDMAPVRRVMYRLLNMCGMFTADADPNPTVMAHHVGERSAALKLYNALKEVSPGWYSQAEREIASNEKSRKKEKAHDE